MTLAVALLALSAAPATTLAAQAAPERVRIAEPFIELHTGAGRGYPVFFVAPRGEAIEILMRRTDWFRVRTEDGKEGWVHRAQLESTITEAGGAKTFRDVLLDDYLNRRVEMGAAWGQFGGEPMLKLWTAYRASDTLSVEGTYGQVQGVYSGTTFWHLNVNVEPWSDRRFSPYFGVGLGMFNNIPNQSLVSAIDTTAQQAVATLGLRYYITDRFVARIDYSLYTAFVSDARSMEFRAGTLGLSFFF